MEPANSLKPKRQLYLDIIRTVAIIAISLNHAVNRTYATSSGHLAEFLNYSLASTLLKTVAYVFSSLGVPLFLMITGVLILNKRFEDQDDIKRFYKNNLLSLFITTEIWYVLIYWYHMMAPSNTVLETEGFVGALRGMVETMLFQNQVTFASMWYMPMILCLYTTLPFVAIVKDKFKSPAPILFLPVILVFLNNMVLPALNAFLSMGGQSTYTSVLREANLISVYYVYVIVGYLVGSGALSKLKDWCIWLVTILSFVLCCIFQFYAYSQPLDYALPYSFPLLPVCAGFLFELIRRKAHWLRSLEKPITYLSRIAFGIYFMHIVIMTTILSVMDFSGWSHAAKLFFLEISSVGGSIILIALLSKIKIFKKYLFLVK